MPAMKTTVSIALCTYNGNKFLKKQLDSFLDQTVLPDEIVISDDGSTDNTLAIIRSYIEANPSIQWNLLQNRHQLGASRNFEIAISACKGDIIFLSDQDDIWNTDKIQRTISFFENHQESDACFSNAELIDEDGRKLPTTLLDNTFFKAAIRKEFKKSDLLYWNILFGNMITGATLAIKGSVLAEVVPFHLELGRKYWHDGWIGLSLMAGGRMGYIDEQLIQYRLHAGQQIGVVVRNDPFEKWIMGGAYNEKNTREYFQRYLAAFTVLCKLKKIIRVDPVVGERIEKEYLGQRKKYFGIQSFPEKKFRLLKWWLRGINYTSFRDLISL